MLKIMDFSERERALEEKAYRKAFDMIIDNMLQAGEIVEHEGKLTTRENYKEIMKKQEEKENLELRRHCAEEIKKMTRERAWKFLELTKTWGGNNARDRNSKNRNY